jgi:murE/murF fusion protein
MSIIDEVLEGIDGVRKGEVHVEPDRERAILWTLEHASRDDVVMIAGKGHETYQEVAGERLPFDDRAVVVSWAGDEHARL